MEILPAIDLRGGLCVRLTRGDYDQETVFDDDPAAIARQWADAGARRLHVVDLDAARDGIRRNNNAILSILDSVEIPVQVGGGIRDAEEAARLVHMGVDRVIFGTAAIEHPEQVESTVSNIGSEHVIVAVDAKDGMAQTHGWLKQSEMGIADLIARMANLGVARFIYTDTGKDGTLTHPNFAAIAELRNNLRYPIIAAGGIASIGDLMELAKLDIEAAISGMAIYSGTLDLASAIRTLDAMSTSGG